MPQATAATVAAQLASFETLLNVQVTIYDFAGFFQSVGRRQYPDHHSAHDRCAFCRSVKDDFGRMRDCLRCDMEPIVLRSQAPAAWRRCHAGVWEVIYPLWEGTTFIGSLMVGCFRRAGEQPLIESTVTERLTARAAAMQGKNGGDRQNDAAVPGRGRKDQAAIAALRQRHRLMRDLDAATEAQLPALVENFAEGLVRTLLQLRRREAAAGNLPVPGAGLGGGSSGSSSAGPSPRHERTRAVELFFRTNLAEGVKIGDLAQALHLSVARTSQILRRDLKSTFPALLRRTRLAEARRLLVVSELPVGQIAALAGFTDRNYFCRVFTQDVGQTPSDYRRQHARPLRV